MRFYAATAVVASALCVPTIAEAQLVQSHAYINGPGQHLGESEVSRAPEYRARADVAGSVFDTQHGTGTGEAYSFGSLANGKIGAFATSTGYPANMQAGTHMYDWLNFNIAGADANTVTQIGMTYSVHGSAFLHSTDPLASYNVSSSIQFGGSSSSFNLFQAGYLPEAYFSQNREGFATSSMSYAGDVWTVTGLVNLIGQNPEAYFYNSLNVSLRGATANYQNTATFSLSLPENVTFTSRSGAFLTQATAPVPEPATWAMMVIGFGVIGAAIRRRSEARLDGMNMFGKRRMA